MGSLCRPDEFFAYAAALSYVESYFVRIEAEEDIVNEVVAHYKRRMKKAPPDIQRVFDWYCEICREGAVIINDPSWKEDPRNFTKTVRAYLVGLLFMGRNLDKSTAMAHYITIKLFDELINDTLKDWDEPHSLIVKMIRCVLYPIGAIYRIRSPRYKLDIDKQMLKNAHVLSQKLLMLCERASDDQRVFSFEIPKDQIEKTMALDGLNISTTRDGTVIMGGLSARV